MEFEGVDLHRDQKNKLVAAAGGRDKAAQWIVSVTRRGRNFVYALHRRDWPKNKTIQDLNFQQAIARLQQESAT